MTERNEATKAHNFRYIRTEEPDFPDYDARDIYRAVFELPDDGTPHSQCALRIDVMTREDGEHSIELTLVTSNGARSRSIATAETCDTDTLVTLLYPAAHKVVRKTIKPR